MATSYTLGKHYEQFIAELVSSGRYSTASEVMRDSLRLMEEREDRRKAKLEALRSEIQKGLDSGSAQETDVSALVNDVKSRGRRRRAGGAHGA
jgi:antitoxin ParD1/3/4